MKRGTVCWVNLEDASPPEFGKTRPGLIVSNTEQNSVLPTVVVLPISGQPPEIWPLRIAVSLPAGKKSFAVVPGIRQVSKSRIREVIFLLPEGAMEEVSQAVSAYLSD